MTVLLLILSSLCIVLVALTGWLFGRDRTNRLDIEKLYDAVAQLTKDQMKTRRAAESCCETMPKLDGKIEMCSKKISVLHEKIEKQEEKIEQLDDMQENIGDALSERVEKLWNEGVQSIVTWNPFATDELSGGK